MRLFPPKPISPADDTVMAPSYVPFSWDDWSIYDSAYTYTLQYSADPTFASGTTQYAGLTAKSYNADSLGDNLWYWRVRAVDPFGDESAWSPTWSFEVNTPYVLGDYNGDEILDVTDVVGMINLAFRGGTLSLPPPERMDINCDTVYNIADVVLLINHVFRGSAAPACP
jgi:hypothetical protein